MKTKMKLTAIFSQEEDGGYIAKNRYMKYGVWGLVDLTRILICLFNL